MIVQAALHMVTLLRALTLCSSWFSPVLAGWEVTLSAPLWVPHHATACGASTVAFAMAHVWLTPLSPLSS